MTSKPTLFALFLGGGLRSFFLKFSRMVEQESSKLSLKSVSNWLRNVGAYMVHKIISTRNQVSEDWSVHTSS